MEVEYDTSETSFRKFMALGVIQSILGNRVTISSLKTQTPLLEFGAWLLV